MVNGRTQPGQRGFTLIEVTIAVAIVAATAAAGIGVALSSRSLAVATAAAEFDHVLDSTRTIARETSGATIVFSPDAFGDGTDVRVLTGGPNGALAATTLPIVHTRAAIAEVASLGATPFAFVVHATGLLGGRPGFRLDTATTTPETPCPPSGSFHFTIAAAGATADRFVPCRIDLAATGPVALTAWPAASTAPSPTPCPSCTTATLPPVPSSSPTCPPGYTPIAGGCAPAAAPAYHVTASASSATLTVGGTDGVTAQATLINPLTAPPGTPATVPITAQAADGTCSVTPAGSQPSGSTFAITGLTPGTCTVTVQADVSNVARASSDSATLTMTVVAGPSPAPSSTPQTCDLTANGKCYHLIVPQTNQTFTKFVEPATSCDASQPPNCVYVDQIDGIQLSPPYIIQPPVAPTDADHELLFELDGITAAGQGCLPYIDFVNTPASALIVWPSNVIGLPIPFQVGVGDPSKFLTRNQVVQNPGTVTAQIPWSAPTTLTAAYNAVQNGEIGAAQVFTYSGDVPAGPLQWYADFPGCDASGDPNASASEYGLASLSIEFKIYQAN